MDDSKIKQLAIRYLARPVSEKKLVDYLEKKGASAEFIDDFLKQARENGWVDDEHLGRRIVEECGAKFFGPARIKIELLKKGIPEGLSDRLVTEALEKKGESERLAEALAAFPDSNRGRLYRRLLRHGFDETLVTDKIENR